MVNDVPPTGDYSFAKYNKVFIMLPWWVSIITVSFWVSFTVPSPFMILIRFFFFVWVQSVDVLKYTDDEYENHLTDPVSVCSCFYFMYMLALDNVDFVDCAPNL